MAFKLTKKQRADLVALQDAYRAAAEALSKALTELASDWRADFDDRPEKWQEGEVGTEVRHKIYRIQDVAHACAYLMLVNFDDLSA